MACMDFRLYCPGEVSRVDIAAGFGVAPTNRV